MAYKGMMLTGVPNMIYTIGYTNNSWTLKADLVANYACRLINHMDNHHYARAMPVNTDPSISPRPFLDLAAGYVQRCLDELPKQGSKRPWRLSMNYLIDIIALRCGPVTDRAMTFLPRAKQLVPAAEPKPATTAHRTLPEHMQARGITTQQ